MKPYILFIGVIDKNKKTHSVSFDRGLNVITGKSSTGKSALMEIFDYCFGSSDFTIPVGEITNKSSVYFVIFKLKNSFLVLAREPKSKKVFIRDVDCISIVDDEPIFPVDFFEKKYFLPLTDFNKELGGYFGLDITDVDVNLDDITYRRKKSASPTVRSFTSFMLQHQNLIANKHAVFFRFDQKEKRDQVIEHIKIFLGMADQDYFLLNQELNMLRGEVRKVENLIPKKREEFNKKLAKLNFRLHEYKSASGTSLVDVDASNLVRNPFKWLRVIQSININIDSTSDENTKAIQEKETQRLELTKDLRELERIQREYKSSIKYVEEYKEFLSTLNYPNEVVETISLCPFCESESNIIENEYDELSKAVNWLNSELRKTPYLSKSYKAKEKEVSRKIFNKKKELYQLDNQLRLLNEANNELKRKKSLYEVALKSKLNIENFLEDLTYDEKPTDLEIEVGKLKTRIKDVEDKLHEYNVDSEMKNAQLFISKTMNEIGNRLDFEKSYMPINLGFSFDTFDIWHKQGKNKVFLRSMGSGANWLYCHLALFMSMHKLFCVRKESCMIPPILFIDQPTQVYFPNISSDNKGEFVPRNLVEEGKQYQVDEDIKSVENFFNEIIDFCESTEEETGIMPQIIITDHADNLKLSKDRKFDKYVRARWRNRGFIA
ncbi:DUF3732 domain-containing protein [Photobacterium sp. GJ3]|uniref:DUF3732 domain-containing protein n=1 Tax=Photobacterium sp. GJ3 TaxID=2829502 RepID=UPI001B8B63E3|nr:DUF3732 domain-containing protein [Photobacterium sp. GJ3]QUJ68860.1 DUF3732 domain-containing protein [Photobacterium sp. GJ3]